MESCQTGGRSSEDQAPMTMRVLSITEDSIVDGEGLRTVIFFSGCPHKCPGCHNFESWNYYNGSLYTADELFEVIKSNPLNDVTFSGGEPFFQAEAIIPLAQKIKALGKSIWSYTGYEYEWLLHQGNAAQIKLLSLIDVLVDGPYIKELTDTTLRFRGSANQRIIRLSNRGRS